MSSEELRLECLKLAIGSVCVGAPAHQLVDFAKTFADFVIGADRAALADEAKAAVDRMR